MPNLEDEEPSRASTEYETLIDYQIVHFGVAVASKFNGHVGEVPDSYRVHQPKNLKNNTTPAQHSWI